MLRNRRKVLKVAILVAIMTIGCNTGVLAANEYTSNAKNFLVDGAKDLAIGVSAILSVKYFAKRQIVQFISFALLAAIIFAFIYKPDGIQSIGAKLLNIIFGI